MCFEKILDLTTTTVVYFNLKARIYYSVGYVAKPPAYSVTGTD